jgi:hypothetical protein
MKRSLARPMLAAACVSALALAGCGLGSDDAAPDEDGDIRATVMNCFEAEDIDARFEGEEGNEEIVIGDGPGAPRVRFFLTSGESEAAHFQGEGEGSEQIGATWLYVNEGSDDLLEQVENCLAEQ